jgi:hypothetical protein
MITSSHCWTRPHPWHCRTNALRRPRATGESRAICRGNESEMTRRSLDDRLEDLALLMGASVCSDYPAYGDASKSSSTRGPVPPARSINSPWSVHWASFVHITSPHSHSHHEDFGKGTFSSAQCFIFIRFLVASSLKF